MRYDAKNLCDRKTEFLAFLRSDDGIRFVVNLEELVGLLVGCYILRADTGEGLFEEIYKIICGLSWCFSGHSFASVGAQGSLIRQPLGRYLSLVYDSVHSSTYL